MCILIFAKGKIVCRYFARINNQQQDKHISIHIYTGRFTRIPKFKTALRDGFHVGLVAQN